MFATNRPVMERNSLYLEKKAANLANALLFFIASSHHQRRADRLITFLDQIEFWDWEMDELLFSYANFAERSAAFNTEVPGEHAADKGLFVRKPHRRVSPWASLTAVLENPNNRRRIRVVAPPDALAATVQVWHTGVSSGNVCHAPFAPWPCAATSRRTSSMSSPRTCAMSCSSAGSGTTPGCEKSRMLSRKIIRVGMD